ncbi:F-box associated ubiquitination effector family protein [Raphanus sativus]|nr:F-box associated ubiquitination effector family protein [Raphanus sativus]
MYMLGYDPVEDQYKVLALDDWSSRLEHQVKVLGGEETWREAPCVAYPHVVCTRGLYMNGTIYYGAYVDDINYLHNSKIPKNSIIGRFDVRLETFTIIKVPSRLVPTGYHSMWLADPRESRLTDKSLINYRGRIGVVENPREVVFDCGF